MTDFAKLIEEIPVLKEMSEAKEVTWLNPEKIPFVEAKELSGITMADIRDAESRLARFAPLIMEHFPETEARGGIIESELVEIPAMKSFLQEELGASFNGRLLLKKDSHLDIAGSIKARGGIYEVLKHTEELALENGMLSSDDVAGIGDPAEIAAAYRALGTAEAREVFSKYKIQVGSTGNLGLSIGIMSAAIGYNVIVHMSADAKQWKKDLLRQRGATVVEYASDYGEAVKQGRAQSDADPMSYFVDDENSVNLFMGYAVAALRLVDQLKACSVTVDSDHPLFVYIPCGVGGAPGGVAFGLKQVFGDDVHIFFVEPVQAPCMLAGMASGLDAGICVQDIGLTGITDADGLAVGRPSGFVGSVMKPLLSGEMTVSDGVLYDYMRGLVKTENVFIEPSSCAAFHGVVLLEKSGYVEAARLSDKMTGASHIAWATGGRLVPEDVRKEYMETHK